MKLLMAVFAVVTLISAADPPARKTPAPKVIQPLQIPAGAVESEPGTFRYTGAQGTKWIYRQTPFGVARMADVPADRAVRAAEARRDADVKATEDGDTIRFECPGPFGVYKWQKNKSELDETEQAVWNRQRAQTTAKQD